MTAPNGTKPTPPRPGRTPATPTNAAPPSPAAASKRKFEISHGRDTRTGQRVVIYGTGGIGKTSLCSTMAHVGKTPLFLDVEDGTRDLGVDRIPADYLETLEDLRAALADGDLVRPYDAIVVDSATKVEDLIAAQVCKRSGVDKLEEVDGGFGKGYRALYEMFLAFLGDLDAQVRAGRTVVLICHDTTAKVPNPTGADFIRYEPRLYQSSKNSLRERVKEWADHVFAVLYDVDAKNDKAQGSGTRAIYTQEMPTQVAKSRTLRGVYPFTEGDASLWLDLFGAK